MHNAQEEEEERAPQEPTRKTDVWGTQLRLNAYAWATRRQSIPMFLASSASMAQWDYY